MTSGSKSLASHSDDQIVVDAVVDVDCFEFADFGTDVEQLQQLLLAVVVDEVVVEN